MSELSTDNLSLPADDIGGSGFFLPLLLPVSSQVHFCGTTRASVVVMLMSRFWVVHATTLFWSQTSEAVEILCFAKRVLNHIGLIYSTFAS